MVNPGKKKEKRRNDLAQRRRQRMSTDSTTATTMAGASEERGKVGEVPSICTKIILTTYIRALYAQRVHTINKLVRAVSLIINLLFINNLLLPMGFLALCLLL